VDQVTIGRPDEPQYGREFAPLESTPPTDPYAPIDYPTEVPPHGAYPPPGYPGGYPPPYPPGQAYGYPPPYPPGGYPPPYGGPYATQSVGAGTNGKAIGALVTSLCGLLLCSIFFVPSIVGLILGVIALGETKRTGQQGRGLALSGVIIGAVAILWGVLVWVFVFSVGDTGTTTGYDY
jgi:hypothetical protein